jgi:hypothetical protein
VGVGGGIIEVVGTKFVVDQGDRDGSVDLIEGRIRFLRTSGPPVEIRPGERFRWTNGVEPTVDAWGDPAESASGGAARQAAGPSSATTLAPKAALDKRAAEAPSEASGSHADSQPAPRVSVEDAIQRAIRLRGEGRYGEARSVLAELHGASLDAHAAEILSFEEGDLLEHFERDSAICAHWQQHQARFPTGQYRSVVSAKLSRLGCP